MPIIPFVPYPEEDPEILKKKDFILKVIELNEKHKFNKDYRDEGKVKK